MGLCGTPEVQSVMVMDNGGRMTCACLGGQLSKLAEKWGWSGVVVHGCIRDVNEVNTRDVGISGQWGHAPSRLPRR